MEKILFGTTSSGQEVSKYTLTNASGAQISVIDFGAILVSVMVPDKDGVLKDVVLGYDNLPDYEVNTCYFGSTIGRNGNRIANVSFEINGVTYKMPDNENGNNLHSGPNGYEKRMWDVKEACDDHVTFSIVSPDGDQGCPGNFEISVTYTLTEDNQVQIHYEGVCDQDTLANMTNHSYFNLSGHDGGPITDIRLMIDADGFNPVIDSASIPTGVVAPVAGTPMDFTTAKEIGRDIDAEYEQLQFTGGYDHNYVLNNQDAGMRLIAKAESPKTGIVMEVYTDLPGVQLYCGNFIEPHPGKGGVIYDYRHAFCLETQYYPNAINVPEFPSPLLKKGEKYDTTTIYKFI